MLCIDEGDLERASQHIDAAAIHNPSSPTVEYVRGTICARSARFPDALLHLNNVLAIVPNHLRALLNRSAVHHALEQWDAALEDAEHVLDLAPDLLLARSRRAECKMALGEWEDAEADLAIILATNPDHVHALTQSAACKLAMGRPEHAESPLNQALRLDPDHAPAWHQRGLLYLEYGRIDVASRTSSERFVRDRITLMRDSTSRRPCRSRNGTRKHSQHGVVCWPSNPTMRWHAGAPVNASRCSERQRHRAGAPRS